MMPDDQSVHLAEPSGPAPPWVVLCHDWYGPLPHVRAIADELAAAGLVAVAPDLYDGRTTTDPGEAESLAGQMDRAAPPAPPRAARGGVDGGRVGVLGWSLGGMYAVSLAAGGDIDAAVLYYAAGDEDDAAR